MTSLSTGQAVNPHETAHAREVPQRSPAVPEKPIEPHHGVADFSPYVRPGDHVLHLGAGSGAFCFVAAQFVGATGRVMGIEYNDELLAQARNRLPDVAERLGYGNIDFRRALNHDLKLDLELLAAELQRRPVQDAAGWLELRHVENRLRRERPLVASDSVDCVLLNGVASDIRPEGRTQFLSEIFRVLKRGGRAVITDTVSDETASESLPQESGAPGTFREDEFLQAFEQAGFHGIELIHRQCEPRQVVAGIEFRAVTVRAYKGRQGPCFERRQALMYRGPFRQVEDDDGHVYRRGERVAVCDKTFHLLQTDPYVGQFEPIEPVVPVPLDQAPLFDCRHDRVRHPRETKATAGLPVLDVITGECCTPGDGCC